MTSSQEKTHIIMWKNPQGADMSSEGPCQTESCKEQKSKSEIMEAAVPKSKLRTENAKRKVSKARLRANWERDHISMHQEVNDVLVS